MYDKHVKLFLTVLSDGRIVFRIVLNSEVRGIYEAANICAYTVPVNQNQIYIIHETI